MPDAPTPVFDGHNDALLKLYLARKAGRAIDFAAGADEMHLDLPKARAGGIAGGLFAMFTTSVEERGDPAKAFGSPRKGAPITFERATEFTDGMLAVARELAEAPGSEIRICTDAAGIRAALAGGKLAMVLHIEGAEPIDTGFAALERLYGQGLRSIGIVWSRQNAFGDGVPFTFPGSPDQGEGLTAAGLELVRRCNDLGVLIDVSHLNEKGFWDVARTSRGPIVASHSNVHALCPSPRNLTDAQLAAIRDSGGIVGLNFATGFLRADGNHGNADVPVETMIRHLDYLLEKLGEDGVGIGSDFDGCTLPRPIGNAAGVPVLIEAMRTAGYGGELIGRIARENWLAVLERTWGH